MTFIWCDNIPALGTILCIKRANSGSPLEKWKFLSYGSKRADVNLGMIGARRLEQLDFVLYSQLQGVFFPILVPYSSHNIYKHLEILELVGFNLSAKKACTCLQKATRGLTALTPPDGLGSEGPCLTKKYRASTCFRTRELSVTRPPFSHYKRPPRILQCLCPILYVVSNTSLHLAPLDQSPCYCLENPDVFLFCLGGGGNKNHDFL